MRKVMPSELLLNQPLPWSIYDGHGNLLLKAGNVISIAKHINALIVRGAYTEAPLPRRRPEASNPTDPRAGDPVTSLQAGIGPREHVLSIFARVDALAMTLERLHKRLQENSLQAQLAPVVRSLAHAVMEASKDNPDALLAACHLDRHHAYLVVQQLLSTVMAEITARAMRMDDAARLSLVCAALTRDIALLPVQQQLDTQTAPLEPAQITMLHSHPQRTMEILMGMGVDDPLWLSCVHQHHERQDGSGYPRALQGEAILSGARVLAIADSYAAMVTPRPNRVGHLPKDALQTLQAQGAQLYDTAILQLFADALTEHPPGTLVRLSNGETGFIRTRKKVEGQPDLWLLYNDSGVPTMRPKRCDASDPAYAITDILRVEACRSAHLVMTRMWSQT